ncbi:MAG: sodium/glutamate symporter [Actinomycetota bacterium]|nr:sodium/glutamate symporter [Actinomycetota bacterium]
MENLWLPARDFLFLSLFLAIAMVLKNKIKILQKYLIPTSIIGGFIGLILGSELLGWVKLDTDTLGTLIYHLMAIGFISLALKDRDKTYGSKMDNINTGLAIITAYLVQGILGFGISLALAYTILPGLFPPFGLLLPLGFAQGPGQSYAIGRSWEELGFTNGGNIGLSVATIGFLWAIIFGIPLLNFLVRYKKRLNLGGRESKISIIFKKRQDIEEKHTENIPKKLFIDSLTIQIVLIGLVYLLTYLALMGMSYALKPLGSYGDTVAELLWGFHFVIATMIAIIARIFLNFLKRKNWLHINYPDNFILQRISAGSFDYMVVAAIAAISISTFKQNWIPILIITSVGGLATLVYTYFLCKRIYKSYMVEHIVSLFGMWTGTITTGVALLREVDPHSRSNAAENLVLGSAVALPLGIPLMFILGLAVSGYRNGNPMLYVYALLIFIVFLAVLLFLLLYRNRKKKA